MLRFIVVFFLMLGFVQAWTPSSIAVPLPPQEFRAVWVASVYNLDWPSRAGLSAGAQQAELRNVINLAARLRLNAVLLQVRPSSDALYKSSLEPWSNWLSGPGVSPGYDPLAYAVQYAHANGVELHAWFNPFRAKTSASQPVGRGHLSLTNPGLMRKGGSAVLANPSDSDARNHALRVILDVVARYDIDGVHIDDYFYPYPAVGGRWSPAQFADGKSPAQRRAYIDGFISDMYFGVKRIKPWVRVGISPFGIWRPGNPPTIEAGVDAYEHLGCDSRKWLMKGWLDYLAPQLYWRISPAKQSFTTLMQWWSAQSTARPVWPGIATARIKGAEDPSRPASEIANQVLASRSLARHYPGQCFWSMKSIQTNKDGIQSHLARLYPTAAVPPPMPWSGSQVPGAPQLQAQNTGKGIVLQWQASDNFARKWVIQARYGNQWAAIAMVNGGHKTMMLPVGMIKGVNAFAVQAVSAFGNVGKAGVVIQ